MAYSIRPSLGLIYLAGAFVGSYLPDCDTHFSAAGMFLPLWIVLPKQRLEYINRQGNTVSTMTRHRTVTHSITFMLAFTLLSLFVDIRFALGILLGYGLHLIADSTTITRCPYLFWPLKK